MAGRRSRWAGLTALGALVLPACATTRDPQPEVRAAASVVVASGTEFGTLPSVPGERIPLHPELAAAAQEPPAVPVATPPKPREVPAVSVAAAPLPPLAAAVQAYLDENPERAAEHLRELDPPNRALMAELLPPVVALAQMDLAHARPLDLGVLLNRFEPPLQALAAGAALYIPKAVLLWTYPTGFGKYEPLPPGYAYPPGHLAELYVEVRNVPSVLVGTPDGDRYLTKLDTTIRIRDAAGRPVDLLDAESKVDKPAIRAVQRDFTLSPIRDYFKTFRIVVPRASGRYTLTVEFSDPETQRSVSQTVTFEVRGS